MFRFLSKTFIFFFNDTATTEIYTLSLHDALPIYPGRAGDTRTARNTRRHRARLSDHTLPRILHRRQRLRHRLVGVVTARSEEHTSELQSLRHLVCRLLLEKKKYINCNRLVS